MRYNQARLRRLNTEPLRANGEYVLYWMQIYRRLERNHALDYALRCSRELGKPLVIYEGLRLRYPWASARTHAFVLAGMAANHAAAKERGLNYWAFVETPKHDRGSPDGHGLLHRLAARAAVVVTDDYPCYIVPGQSEALARTTDVGVFAVDGNSVVPLSLLGAPISAAAHLRPRLHKAFAEAWPHRAKARPVFDEIATKRVSAPFPTWTPPRDLGAVIRALPFGEPVPPVTSMPGGTTAARARLAEFLAKRLRGYAEARSQPRAPQDGHASGLSPYLHFGHLSIEEVVEKALHTTGDWDVHELRLHHRGKREGFFSDDADVNGFLDEALTWRDVGFQWHWHRRADTASLQTALPGWAMGSLRAHASDPRAYTYSIEEWEAGATHDPLWNAAQRELVATGTIHNYLRMLWGKKVIEWSKSPDEAYRTLVHLNNKYALDGRDPNSWTGILWCFGLFDRPWAPERKVLGVLRYMSSANTAKKFKLDPYYRYVESLPTIEAVRSGHDRS
ncbi:MAG: deoxyribodipyrimidine photolyase [Vicinamibacteria bacterium]|nr:deoxyribodipyrimidine photolyase [Vicinamibacteria bacterium]